MFVLELLRWDRPFPRTGCNLDCDRIIRVVFPAMQAGGPLYPLYVSEDLRTITTVWRSVCGVDDSPVWCISCFYSRKGYRRQGLRLLWFTKGLKIIRPRSQSWDSNPLRAARVLGPSCVMRFGSEHTD